jgi:hypothetical protein
MFLDDFFRMWSSSLAVLTVLGRIWKLIVRNESFTSQLYHSYFIKVLKIAFPCFCALRETLGMLGEHLNNLRITHLRLEILTLFSCSPNIPRVSPRSQKSDLNILSLNSGNSPKFQIQNLSAVLCAVIKHLGICQNTSLVFWQIPALPQVSQAKY